MVIKKWLNVNTDDIAAGDTPMSITPNTADIITTSSHTDLFMHETKKTH